MCLHVVYLRKLLPYLRNQSEDCLYLNIYAPVTGKKLITRIRCQLIPRHPNIVSSPPSFSPPPSVSCLFFSHLRILAKLHEMTFSTPMKHDKRMRMNEACAFFFVPYSLGTSKRKTTPEFHFHVYLYNKRNEIAQGSAFFKVVQIRYSYNSSVGLLRFFKINYEFFFLIFFLSKSIYHTK